MIYKLATRGFCCLAPSLQPSRLPFVQAFHIQQHNAKRSFSVMSVSRQTTPKAGLQRPRGFSWQVWKRNPKPSKDGMGSDARLIFSNNNKWYMYTAYIALGISTSVMIISTTKLYYDYYTGLLPKEKEGRREVRRGGLLPFSNTGSLPKEIDINHPLVFAVVGGVFSAALLYMTRLMMKRALFRIYYQAQTNTFTGIEFKWNMCKNRVTFGPDDVKLVQNHSLLQDLKGNFMIKQKLYYLPHCDFKSPLFYNIMVGNMKPQAKTIF